MAVREALRWVPGGCCSAPVLEHEFLLNDG